jgi:nucleoside-diphosphate-sugar epimerase
VLAPDQVHSHSLEEYRRVNVHGTENLLKECLINPVKKIICFSSSAAVGLVDNGNIDESVTCNPETDYGISKHESDIAVKRFFEEYNLPIVTLRFTHIYGPGEKRDFLKIVKLIKKGVFPIIGFGENLYPAVYKKDAINSILLALQKGKIGQLYNISDKNSYDLRLIIKSVKAELGIARLSLWVPKYPTLFFLNCLEAFGIPFPISSKNIKYVTAARRFSIEKAKTELNYEPKIDIHEGIKRTINYYKTEGLIK